MGLQNSFYNDALSLRSNEVKVWIMGAENIFDTGEEEVLWIFHYSTKCY